MNQHDEAVAKRVLDKLLGECIECGHSPEHHKPAFGRKALIWCIKGNCRCMQNTKTKGETDGS